MRYVCGCWQRVRIDLARGSVCETHSAAPEKVNTHEWRVRCADCRYGRWCGQSEDEARRLERQHHERHPTHFPAVAYDRVTYDGGGTILRWDNARRRKPPESAKIVNVSDGPAPY